MTKLIVFYDKKQTVTQQDSFSPSARKPALVLKSWRAKKLPIEVRKFHPMDAGMISLAHNRHHVDAVLACEAPNGFGGISPEVAESLRYTTGSFVAAAAYAARHGRNAASLTSGFHHAGYDSSGGFCTFNGLMIAAVILHCCGLAEKVGIVDLDMHYGNGTDDIIRELKTDYVQHYTFGGDSVTRLNAEDWLKKLPGILAKFKDCDVLLFQAGADPHVNDPLGGVLTSEQLRKRDRIVFEAAKKMGIPVAWNLAGGYQKPLRKVLDIHDATAEECISVMNKGKPNGKR